MSCRKQVQEECPETVGEGGRSESRDLIGKSCKVKSEVSKRGISGRKA